MVVADTANKLVACPLGARPVMAKYAKHHHRKAEAQLVGALPISACRQNAASPLGVSFLITTARIFAFLGWPAALL